MYQWTKWSFLPTLYFTLISKSNMHLLSTLYISYHSFSNHSFHTIPFYTIPFHTIPFHTIPFHTIPFHTIPFHTILFHTPFRIIKTCADIFYTILKIRVERKKICLSADTLFYFNFKIKYTFIVNIVHFMKIRIERKKIYNWIKFYLIII